MPSLDRREWLTLAVAGLLVPRVAIAEEKAPPEPKGKLYFLNVDTGALEGIFALDLTSGQWERLADSEPGMSRARIAPSGKTLAYCSVPNKNGQNLGEGIWTIDLTGEAKPKQVSDVNGRLAWSPDSQSLIASGPIDINSNVFQTWRIALPTGVKTRLPVPDTELVVDWSPDGQRLVSYVGSNFLVRKADGTEPQEFVTTADSLKNYRFSANSQRVLYTERTGQDVRFEGSLNAQSLAGGPPVRLSRGQRMRSPSSSAGRLTTTGSRSTSGSLRSTKRASPNRQPSYSTSCRPMARPDVSSICRIQTRSISTGYDHVRYYQPEAPARDLHLGGRVRDWNETTATISSSVLLMAYRAQKSFPSVG